MIFAGPHSVAQILVADKIFWQNAKVPVHGMDFLPRILVLGMGGFQAAVHSECGMLYRHRGGVWLRSGGTCATGRRHAPRLG